LRQSGEVLQVGVTVRRDANGSTGNGASDARQLAACAEWLKRRTAAEDQRRADTAGHAQVGAESMTCDADAQRLVGPQG
jgi:hypothetical protein